MDTQAKIILSRPKEWLNGAKPFEVFIDNTHAGLIRNGSSEEFAVSAGKHQVQCRIAWYSSALFTVDVTEGEIYYLAVKNGMTYYWPSFFLLMAGVLFNVIYLNRQVQRALWANLLQLLLILPTLLYILYYMTAGRKRYLILEEDKENVFAS